MKPKLTPKDVAKVTWIDRKSLSSLKIKEQGLVGGCIVVHYVVTADGEMYFVR